MKIALAQLNYTIGDFDGNKIKIIDAINSAKAKEAELIVFAEHSLCGTPAYDLLNNVFFLNILEDDLTEIASNCDSISALIGVPLSQGANTVSAAALIQNRKIVRYFTKHIVDSRDEKLFLSQGEGGDFFKFQGRKIAVLLGSDINNEEGFSGFPDYIINMNVRQYSRGIIEARHLKLKRLAFTKGANLLFVNQVGASTDVIYDGSSAAYNSHGDTIVRLKSFEEDFAVIDFNSNPRTAEVSEHEGVEDVYQAIRLGMKDFFVKNNHTKACVGLSGGIDSAVVAAIAADVLGPDKLRALMMPSEFSSKHSVDDAIQLAENLRIKYDVIPINRAYDDVVGAMEPVFGKNNKFGIAEENIQARIRCVMLMALSNKHGHILLNTSNKSELALGWGTLYGDNTGAISILGDIYKSEVYALARYINRHETIIPENILTKQPSAELRPGQKDTDDLPAYDITDAILYRFIEEGQPREEIVNAGFDVDVVNKIFMMILRNEPKRYQFCPTLRISGTPFGVGWIMPMTGKYGIK